MLTFVPAAPVLPLGLDAAIAATTKFLLIPRAVERISHMLAVDMHMGLYIRDEGVNELAGRLAGLTGTSKTQAVREALELRLRALRTPETLKARVAALQARARADGIGPDGAGDKALMDELSGDL